MGKDLEIVQGTARDFVLQIYNPDGTDATGFLSTDTLTSKVWGGQDQAVLFSPSVSWLTLPSPPPHGYDLGQYVISFNNADTATWLPAKYDYQVYLTRSGRTGEITGGGGNLQVLPSPGTATALPTYCTLQDMLGWCRWLQNLSVFEADETGFLTQRAAARNWMDNMIQRHYRLTAGLNISVFGNPVPTWGPRRTGGYSVWLQAQLDAGPAQPTNGPANNFDLTPVVPGLSPGLMINQPRRVREICAKYAAFLVMQDVIVGSGQRENWYSAKADWLMLEVENLVKGFTAEISPVNGYPTITVECGLIDAMRG